MRKSLVMCGIAALAFASCTQNEVLNVNENRAINFDGFVGKPTKAAVNSVDNLTAFQVFGGYGTDGALDYDNVYDNVAVTRSGGASPYTWTPAETKYWQQGYKYTFNAYAPALGSSNGTASVDANGVTITDFVASNGETDLLIAETKTVDATNTIPSDAVQFTFNHVLSMIRFTFYTTLKDVNITISDLKVNQVPNKATYTAAASNNGNWGTMDNKSKVDYSLTVSGSITSDNSTGKKSSSEKIVIPQSFNAGLTVTFKLSATGALTLNNVEHTVTLPTNAWVKGKRYNYNAEITNENINPGNPLQPITFSDPTVTSWDDNNNWTDGSVTFPAKP